MNCGLKMSFKVMKNKTTKLDPEDNVALSVNFHSMAWSGLQFSINGVPVEMVPIPILVIVHTHTIYNINCAFVRLFVCTT